MAGFVATADLRPFICLEQESTLPLPAEKLASVIFVFVDPSTLSDTQENGSKLSTNIDQLCIWSL